MNCINCGCHSCLSFDWQVQGDWIVSQGMCPKVDSKDGPSSSPPPPSTPSTLALRASVQAVLSVEPGQCSPSLSPASLCVPVSDAACTPHCCISIVATQPSPLICIIQPGSLIGVWQFNRWNMGLRHIGSNYPEEACRFSTSWILRKRMK